MHIVSPHHTHIHTLLIATHFDMPSGRSIVRCGPLQLHTTTAMYFGKGRDRAGNVTANAIALNPHTHS